MKKYFYIFLVGGILASTYCCAQNIEEKGVFSREKRGQSKQPTTGKQTTSIKKPDTQGTLIISTNEDCIVKIGSRDYDTLKAGRNKTLTLPFGTYTLVATNIKTRDELSANVVVKAQTAAFLIDLRSLITIREKRLDSLDKIKKATEKITAKAAMDSIKKIVKDVKPAPELATIQDLATNMVQVPGGSFIMGVKGGKVKELLPHTVTIKPVMIGKYEVTQKQWEAIMGASHNNSSNRGCSTCPIDNVSWVEVDSFILKINTMGKNKFRLPTEAEWEYVAKNAIEKEVETPDNPSQKNVEDLVEQTAWYNKNSEGKTHPVGSKKPLLGIHDLLGNVAEWCIDFYRPDYQKDTQNNPRGPEIGKEKIVKGGSYMDTENLKPAVRVRENPSTRKNTIGFRLVMEAN